MDGYIKKLREKVGNDKVIINFAAACIANDEGQLLLQKRGDDSFRGMWGLPGGAIEIDESYEEAVVREVKEETGLDVSVVKLIGVYSKYFATYSNGDESQTIVTLFLCQAVSNTIAIDHKETLDIQYFDKENMPKLFNQQHEDMVKDWTDGKYGFYR